MFRSKDLQSTEYKMHNVYYGHCSFTNVTRILCTWLASDRISAVRLSHGVINQKRLVKIMQFSPYSSPMPPVLAA